ncbi:hydrolase [Frankia sp. CcI49]|uniref:HAD family hydrolase n=1 Tax=Frankia sp. CcI49 TaxID=1745382 RepID=UPI000977C24E|nr:HAD family phosphatase [Frankia sp. CcI49]ONH56227.1 hydrolase [Frankia sp. CcI49]
MGARCVVLDIGGVLEVTPQTGWMPRWEQRTGLAAGTVLERLADVFLAGSLGTMSESEVIAMARARLDVSEEQLEDFWGLMWDEYLGTLNVELFAWFRALRPRFRTGILSNSFVGAREREQERYGFADVTDVIVYSHEVGLAKPDPRIYALTCERLGVAPDDVVFLDDTPAAVEGARVAGWHGVLFRDTAQAIAEVEAYLAP